MRKQLSAIAFLALSLFAWSGCSTNNVENASDLTAYFDTAHVQGCFALYDNNRGEFLINNKTRYLRRFSPGETFHLVTALAGLQTGTIFNEKSRFGNQTLAEALKTDSTGYFAEAVGKLGKDSLVKWINKLSYGNMNIGSPLDSLGQDDSLKISPDEQMGLVKRMYFKQLPLQDRTQLVVDSALIRESNTNYTLSYIAGTARGDGGSRLGWVVGWEQEGAHPYFFVLNIEGGAPGEDLSQTGLTLLRKILVSQEFFKGVK